MSRLRNTHYTLVQHSAWAVKQDPAFRNAVEPAGVSNHAELGRVVDAGGLLFRSHPEAEDAADDASQYHIDRHLFGGQHPDRVTQDANPGDLTFDVGLAIGGRALYLPKREAANG